MKQKHQRLLFLSIAIIAIAAIGILLLRNLEDYIVYFYSPSDIASAPPAAKQNIRAGGMVKTGSVRQEGSVLYFTLTDYAHDINVRYAGSVPSLFREEQGIVAEGTYDGTLFQATTILAKHDENYMPPEVAKTVKNGDVSRNVKENWKDNAAQTIKADE